MRRVPAELLTTIDLGGHPPDRSPGELPPALQAEADRMGEEGNRRMGEGRFVEALAAFRAGLELSSAAAWKMGSGAMVPVGDR